MRSALLALLLTIIAADRPASLKTDPVFLTRDGCVNTPAMVFNLEDALKALGWPNDYRYINISKLSPKDARTGMHATQKRTQR